MGTKRNKPPVRNYTEGQKICVHCAGKDYDGMVIWVKGERGLVKVAWVDEYGVEYSADFGTCSLFLPGNAPFSCYLKDPSTSGETFTLYAEGQKVRVYFAGDEFNGTVVKVGINRIKVAWIDDYGIERAAEFNACSKQIVGQDSIPYRVYLVN